MDAIAFLLASTLALAATPAAKAAPAIVVDACETVAEWKAVPADGVDLKLASDAGARGKALRLDFNFRGGGGYAVAHRAVSLDLPANYRFTFRIRGECRPNNLEFKLIDDSGDNVWWSNQRDFEFPAGWTEVVLKKRNLTFAWGPQGGGEPRHIAALEIAVTAGHGGQGRVWIDDIELQPLPPPDTTARAIVATASSSSRTAGATVDGAPRSAWASAAGDAQPWLRLDLGAEREFGGLVIDWVAGLHATDYAIELSSDGRAWRAARTVEGGDGGRDELDLPESEARFVRVRVTGRASPAGVAIANVDVKPLAWGATPQDFFAAVAKDSPRGDYPRSLLGELVYWTVVGLDFDSEEGLLDEYGRLETGQGAWSIEPFLRVDGDSALVSWANVETRTSLAQGDLPVPSVEWRRNGLRFTVTAFGVGMPGHSALLARYRLHNDSGLRRSGTVDLALRPFQVNPPTQFLNAPGGVAPIHDIALDGRIVRVNGDRGLVTLTQPFTFGASTFERGDVVAYLRRGRLPAAQSASDARARACGVLAYVFDLAPGAEREVDLLVPLHERPIVDPPVGRGYAQVHPYVEALQASCEERWRAQEDRVTIGLPDSAMSLVRTLRSQLAWVLINRDGPAIQPGSRSYARSWIRDGCLTSSALLRMGESEAVRQFLEWFAPFQFPSGKAPCCVDARGADPVPEHDSSGELIEAIAEYVRFTGDRAFAERMWPHVAAAAAWLDTLRAQRRTPEWRTPANAPYFGLLPPSISHEGYSAKPMHSYWDDFFALRGFQDAAFLAAELGRPERVSLEHDRDEFQRDLAASLAAAMRARNIDYLPGCADLGDFDATSTSIALNPGNAEAALPAGALERTFEKYWTFFQARRDGREPWDAFTPYEWRNVGAMVRLGWRDRANEAMEWLLRYRRPTEWNQWAEVVWRDPRAAKFIGDMPHTWVGTDFVRSLLDMLAYEREADSTLVVGAGVPRSWLADSGVVVRGLHTRWGTLDLDLRAIPATRGGAPAGVVMRVASADLRVPRGGIVLAPPADGARSATLGARAVPMGPGHTVTVHRLPATVTWWPDAAPAHRR